MYIGICAAIVREYQDVPKATSLVVTFHTWDQASAEYSLGNFTVISQYGRRLVLELGREVDMSTDVPMITDMIGPDLVQIVEVNGIVTEDALIPVDFQWHLANSEPFGINVENIWSLTNSTKDVIVAILDGGIAEAAKGAFLNLDVSSGYDFVDSDTISQDGSSGRDSDPTDPFVSNPGCTPSWHGTMTASTLAASHNLTMGLGIKGVAQNVTIIPMRVTGKCGSGDVVDVAAAITYAAGGLVNGVGVASRPAKIISISNSAPYSTCPDFFQSAVNQAIDLGAVIVASAGNNNGQSASTRSPANCIGVISVGATARNGNMASYSNLEAIMTAPGGDSANPIRLLRISDTGLLQVGYSTGTSFSTPIVSGALALVLSLCPEIKTASQFVNMFNINLRDTHVELNMRILFTDGVCSGAKSTCPLYKQQTAALSCNTCPDSDGYRPKCVPVYNTASCERCSVGRYFVRNSTGSKCIMCPSWTYSNTTGATTCETCPIGKYIIPVGSSYCADCPVCSPGQYTICSYALGRMCMTCPIGTYSDTYAIKVSGCTQCPKGTYANLTGSTACLACQKCNTTGYYNFKCTTTSEGECTASCPENEGYRPRCLAWNNATCEQCSPGKYLLVNSTGSKCVNCPVGTFSNVSGATVCLACQACNARGYYNLGCTSTSGGDCVSQCAESYGYRLKCLAWNNATCEQCNPGKYLLGNSTGSKCVNCPVGTFSNVSGATVCLVCQGSNYPQTVGSTSCLNVPATTTAAPVVKCAAGSYKNGTMCSNCDPGTYTNTSNSLTVCTVCAPSYYATSSNSTSCLACQICNTAGFYRSECNATSSGTCVKCTNTN
jgi:hypothetical protein